MLEVGWSEMLVIAIIMIVVVGPKDLPGMLRSIGRTTAKLRAMAGDFQKHFNEAIQEAELEDVKKSVDTLRGLNPAAEIKKQLNPFEKAAADVRSGLNDMMKPQPAPKPAEPVAHAAEPLKTGATAMPELDAGSTSKPQAEKPAVAAAGPAKDGSEPAKASAARTAKQAAKKPARKSA